MSTSYQPAQAWRVAVLLIVYMIINFADKIAVGLLAVPMMGEMKLSPSAFGLIGSSFFWLFAIAGIGGGFIANRVASTGLLLAMAVAWSALQIPMALSSSIGVLILARVLLGIAEGPAWPVSVHALFKWFPNHKRELPVAWLAQGGALGLLGAGIVMPLITAHWGWRMNFLALAAAGMLWSILWLAFGREGMGAEADTHIVVPDAHTRVPYRRLLLEPTILACFLLKFVAYWSLALILTWMPVYLQRGLGFSGVTSGRVYAAIIALSMPLSVGGSWLARKMLERGVSSRMARGRFSAALVGFGGVAFVCLWLTDCGPVWRVLLIALTFGLSQVIYSVGPAMLAEVSPASQRGAILAIDNSIASVAGVLAPLLTGLMVQRLTGGAGYEAGFALCGILMIIGALTGAFAIDPGRAASRIRADLASAGTAAARSTPIAS